MRAVICFLMIGLMAGSDLTLTDAKAQPAFSAGLEIQSVADFYVPLAPYGTWVDVATYGHCWQPTGVPEGWRPYSNGSWEWTDLGWYWVSDEPWAWACYHYGTWIYDPTYGWLWVPGTEWAPAWVAWRESPDYIGWAPCTFDNTAVIAPSLFVFVDIHHFHHRIRPNLLIVNNPTVIERTRFVRNFSRQKHHFDGVAKTAVINSGPNVQTVERATGTQFTARPIGEVVTQTKVPETMKRSPIGKSGPEAPQPAQPTTPPQAVPPPTGREQPRIYPKPSEGTPQTPTPSETKPSQTTPQAAPPTAPAQTMPPSTGQAQPRITAPSSPTPPSQTGPSQTMPRSIQPTTPSQMVSPPTGREQPRVYPTPSQTTTPPQVSPSGTAPQWTAPTPPSQTMPSPTAPVQPRTVIPSTQTTTPTESIPQTRPFTPQPNETPSITTPSQSAPVQPPPTQQPVPPTGREQGRVNPGSQMPGQQVSPPREQSPTSPTPSARPEGPSSSQQRMDNKNP